MGAHNFNVAPKFPPHPKFCIFGRKFSDKEKVVDNIPTAQNLWRQLNWPQPRRHWWK